jgi:hypothetical protein
VNRPVLELQYALSGSEARLKVGGDKNRSVLAVALRVFEPALIVYLATTVAPLASVAVTSVVVAVPQVMESAFSTVKRPPALATVTPLPATAAALSLDSTSVLPAGSVTA